MAGGSARPSPHRYLCHVGAFPLWGTLGLALLVLYGLVELYLAGRVESGRFLLLAIAPTTAGTGMLTAAREGRLDLLLGSGVRRRRVFVTAVLRAVGVPVLAAAVVASLGAWGGGIASIGSLAARGAGTALFTMGLAFAVGLIEPRYVVGLGWILVRVGFLLSPFGFKSLFLGRVPGGGEISFPMWRRIVTAVAFPEILLESAVPYAFVVAAAAVGVLALVVSLRVFETVDFSGRRTE
jgi:hypothetical protein